MNSDQANQTAPPAPKQHTGWRGRVYEIIFESDTPAGKAFDIALIFTILASTAVVMLESMASIRAEYGELLLALEWIFTGLFTVEYILRLACLGSPLSYARSFYGAVDLLAILPTYASVFVPGARYLTVVRMLRILRVFRVLRLVQYLQAMETLRAALRASSKKIFVFVTGVLILVTILGSMMYLIEGPKNGFTSIPRGIYWAIVTLTTVGYGDIAPQTDGGQTMAAFVMILGYGIIAVPTGIVSVELAQAQARAPQPVSGQACSHCSAEGHDPDARYCKVCGGQL
jgi:voltage-gated potassium channel